MNSTILDRRVKAEELFYKASKLAGDRQTAFLDKACAGDDKLRKEVDLLSGGQPLAEAVAAGALTSEEILTVAISASYELGYAHRYGTTHGQVNAQNIMVCGDRRIRLLRFRANASRNPRSDLLGLGAVLNEMIDGREVPQWFRDIAQKAGNPDREASYSTADAMQKDLQRGDYETRNPPASQTKNIIFWLIVLTLAVLLYWWVNARTHR